MCAVGCIPVFRITSRNLPLQLPKRDYVRRERNASTVSQNLKTFLIGRLVERCIPPATLYLACFAVYLRSNSSSSCAAEIQML